MKHALLVSMLVVASSCSVLFDPSKVPTPPTCSALAVPEFLEVRAGEAPGRLTWHWPASEGVYRLCTTVPGAAATCTDVNCTSGDCSSTQDGLATNVRSTGTIAAIDGCTGMPGETRAASATPLDTSADAGWVLEQRNCAVADTTVLSGVVSIDQRGFGCTTSFATGDEGWSDLTLDADLRVSAVASGVNAGFVLEQNATGHRLRFVSGIEGPNKLFPSELQQRTGATDTVMAQGLHTAGTDWLHVRIVTRENVVSWFQGPVEGPLVEVLRWSDRVPAAGRVGITADGTGRFEVRNLRLSTRTEPAPVAPTRITYHFGADGGLPGARSMGITLDPVTCPALDDCDAGCAPPPGALCGRFSRTAFFLDFTQVALGAPRGLDVSRPWEVALRFGLPADAGTFNTTVLGIANTRLLDTAPTRTEFVQTAVAPTLGPGTWHEVHWVFPNDGGFITGRVDGVPVTSSSHWPETTQSRTLDALHVGSAIGASDLFVHELTVSQP